MKILQRHSVLFQNLFRFPLCRRKHASRRSDVLPGVELTGWRRALWTTDRRQKAYSFRSQLGDAKRVVVKLGSAVITRADNYGIALSRLTSIVEQVSRLEEEGREMLMVTSGAVAFGRLKLGEEIRLSMSMRETLSPHESIRHGHSTNYHPDPRAAAAVGQSGLMALYEALFSQYGINIAQVLVTKPDFYNPESRYSLKDTVQELLRLNIVPIINTNDTVVPPPINEPDLLKTGRKSGTEPIISISDNDSLAAHLAVEVGADLMIIVSDVDGIYTMPPKQDGARLLHTYCPAFNGNVTYGEKSSVGMGGMEAKVKAASWALERGVSVVICNGMEESAITRIISGKRVGTFFTDHKNSSIPVENMADNARKGGRILQSLSNDERADIVNRIANLLDTRQNDIIRANKLDIKEAEASGLEKPLLSRLSLTPSKLTSLSDGLRHIALDNDKTIGRVIRRTRISEGMELRQVTVPFGVLMVIFESRPDCLPQVAALSISTGNGLLLKGGKEASHSNRCLLDIVKESLAVYGAEDAVALVSSREDVGELLQLEGYIDLVIPRGSPQLVRTIQQQSRGIPVLGHSEGICHVYVDSDADLDMASKIVRDSKCDYPAACNAMETLLLHRSLVEQEFFVQLCNMLKNEHVNIFAGPRLAQLLTFGPTPAKSMRTEYSGLECAVEVVDNVEEAIQHINNFGSGHTDVIVTKNDSTAHNFIQNVDSACVFHNCSSRFADGYRFGLGAEVGISTSRIHARGPVGIEGLLTTKWILQGSGNAAADFVEGGPMKFVHENLPVSSSV